MATRSGQLNPFVPGSGRLPPYLAGRETEQERLRGLLAHVLAGQGAPRDAVLSGPRGNGKTALLRWFEQAVGDACAAVDVVWLTPSEARTLDDLATALVPPGRFTTLRPDSLSVSVGLGKVGWQIADRPGALAPLLAERCHRRPLVLLLDEAHTLDAGVGQVLLNAGQTVRANSPFLLVMAGTPDLQRHLNTMATTFWSRAEKLGIGRLDEDAAAAAIVQPFADSVPEAAFDADALAEVLAESQGYPYFLQLWGESLWLAARGAARIDASVVRTVRRSVEESRLAYYEDRRDELERMNLLDAAAAVAAAYDGRTTLRGPELDAAISRALGEGEARAEVLRCRDALASTGYVWKPPAAGDAWQPGIPSFMGYVQEQQAG